MFFKKKKSSSKKTAKTKSKSKAAKEIKKAKPDLVSVKIKTHNDKNGGHPHVILDNIDDKHVSVGLSTHKKKGKNSPNYELKVNPLGGKDTSYMRRQGTVAPKSTYSQKRKGAMAAEDFKKAKEYGEKAKRKYIEKKRKKNSNAQHRKGISDIP